MAVRPILYADHPALRQKAKRVTRFDASLQQLIEDMIDTMHAAHGVGLAANQIGVLLQVAVIHIPEEEEIRVLINPEVIKRSGERLVEEGCLSLPGYRAMVKRSETVTVKARDRRGREYRIRNATGLLAQAIEHETDHLNGILYIDRLESLDQLYKVGEPSEAADQPEEAERVQEATPAPTG
jgi:peptide deformylase